MNFCPFHNQNYKRQLSFNMFLSLRETNLALPKETTLCFEFQVGKIVMISRTFNKLEPNSFISRLSEKVEMPVSISFDPRKKRFFPHRLSITVLSNHLTITRKIGIASLDLSVILNSQILSSTETMRIEGFQQKDATLSVHLALDFLGQAESCSESCDRSCFSSLDQSMEHKPASDELPSFLQGSKDLAPRDERTVKSRDNILYSRHLNSTDKAYIQRLHARQTNQINQVKSKFERIGQMKNFTGSFKQDSAQSSGSRPTSTQSESFLNRRIRLDAIYVTDQEKFLSTLGNEDIPLQNLLGGRFPTFEEPKTPLSGSFSSYNHGDGNPSSLIASQEIPHIPLFDKIKNNPSFLARNKTPEINEKPPFPVSFPQKDGITIDYEEHIRRLNLDFNQPIDKSSPKSADNSKKPKIILNQILPALQEHSSDSFSNVTPSDRALNNPQLKFPNENLLPKTESVNSNVTFGIPHKSFKNPQSTNSESKPANNQIEDVSDEKLNSVENVIQNMKNKLPKSDKDSFSQSPISNKSPSPTNDANLKKDFEFLHKSTDSTKNTILAKSEDQNKREMQTNSSHNSEEKINQAQDPRSKKQIDQPQPNTNIATLPTIDQPNQPKNPNQNVSTKLSEQLPEEKPSEISTINPPLSSHDPASQASSRKPITISENNQNLSFIGKNPLKTIDSKQFQKETPKQRSISISKQFKILSSTKNPKTKNFKLNDNLKFLQKFKKVEPEIRYVPIDQPKIIEKPKHSNNLSDNISLFSKKKTSIIPKLLQMADLSKPIFSKESISPVININLKSEKVEPPKKAVPYRVESQTQTEAEPKVKTLNQISSNVSFSFAGKKVEPEEKKLFRELDVEQITPIFLHSKVQKTEEKDETIALNDKLKEELANISGKLNDKVNELKMREISYKNVNDKLQSMEDKNRGLEFNFNSTLFVLKNASQKISNLRQENDEIIKNYRRENQKLTSLITFILDLKNQELQKEMEKIISSKSEPI